MTAIKSERISPKLIGETCLILWETEYLKEGTRTYLLREKMFMGIGVVVGVDTDQVVIKLRMSRMKDFGNGTISGMNIRSGDDFEGKIIPRKKSRRKLYGKNASSSHITACYMEKGKEETFREVIGDLTWISPRDRKEIIAMLPEIRKGCTSWKKQHASEAKT